MDVMELLTSTLIQGLIYALISYFTGNAVAGWTATVSSMWLLGGIQLLCIGEEDTVRQAFNVEVKDNGCFLPHVLSRKKQIVPMLSLLWG